MKKIFFIIILLIIFTSASYPQDEFSPGTPYSMFGIGDYLYSTNLQAEQMGIQGISLFGNTPNVNNPAANVYLKYTTLSGGFKFGFLKASSSVQSISVSKGSVNGINMGIPFSRDNGWVFTFGFNPITDVNYKIQSDILIDTLSVTRLYAGSGGISRINFGMSYVFINGLNTGVDFNYAFGNINRFSYLDFHTSAFTNSYIKKENNFKGIFFKGGLIFELGKIFKSKNLEDFSIGGFYQSGYKLNSSSDIIYLSSYSVVDSVFTDADDFEIPDAFGFGITNKFGKQVLLSSDILFQNWSKFKVGNIVQNNMQNNFRIGIGCEILPAIKGDKTFLESIAYRLGFFYDKSNFILNNESVNRYGFSLGFNIPITDYNSIDLGLSYALRGKTDNNLIKDNYFKITFGFNFGELWFIRPRDEDR
jgi:hypothetical protein